MSKAVMLSIRPKWCEKIASGEKTIEVRKTRPKLETPFKCYIYCTLPKYPHEDFIATNYPRPQFYGGGKVIGEFTCERIYEIGKRGIPENFDYCYLSLNEWGNDDIETEIKAISASCVSKEELNAYGAKAPLLYGWHISDLRIYDEPRELSEFTGLRDTRFGAAPYDIKRAPQSWCYVEAM
jgi:predicted transcriptional regulator